MPLYFLTAGRATASIDLDLLTQVETTNRVTATHLGHAHAHALMRCSQPVAVAEVAALMQIPATVAKVLIADLIDSDALTITTPMDDTHHADLDMLQALLEGLKARL